MDKYPTVSVTELTKLKTIIDNASTDARYLDGRICPYDKPTRELLKSMVANAVVAATIGDKPDGRKKAGAKKKGPVIPTSELEREFQELRDEIKALKLDAKGLEPHERIQVVKTRASLIEKILSMKEKIENIKKMEQFIATVIRIMEDELPQELRLIILEKLEPFAEQED